MSIHTLATPLLRGWGERTPIVALITSGVLALLAGCQSAPLAVWQTFAAGVRPGDASAPPAVAGVQFLKVRSPSGVAFMVLGDTEPPAAVLATPASAVGAPPAVGAGSVAPRSAAAAVDVWYSAGRQVLRLEQGRVVSTAGLPVDWRAVRTSPRPAWSSALNGPVHYLRSRDEMPGYRFGVLERVTIRPSPGPDAAWARAVSNRPHLAWFTEAAEPWLVAQAQARIRGEHPERATADRAGLAPALPVAWFAVDLQSPGEPVVFSRQCLSLALCLDIEPVSSRTAPNPVAPPAKERT